MVSSAFSDIWHFVCILFLLMQYSVGIHWLLSMYFHKYIRNRLVLSTSKNTYCSLHPFSNICNNLFGTSFESGHGIEGLQRARNVANKSERGTKLHVSSQLSIVCIPLIVVSKKPQQTLFHGLSFTVLRYWKDTASGTLKQWHHRYSFHLLEDLLCKFFQLNTPFSELKLH